MYFYKFLDVFSQVMTSYTTKFWSNMMKKDISANFYQKCLILCSNILLNVLHNASLTSWLPWQHIEFQTSPIFKALLATFGIPFWYLLMMPHVDDNNIIIIIAYYYMATIVRTLWLAAERALFSCNDRALWNFFSARRLFWVASKTTCAWAKTTEKMDKVQLYFQ